MRQTLLIRALILKKEGVIHRDERERERESNSSTASCLTVNINEHACSVEFESGHQE